MLVKDIRAGSSAGFQGLSFVKLGSAVFFAANDGTTGTELWRSDGTEAGTVLVKDISLGSESSVPFVTNLNGTLLFAATDSATGRELWRSDGTTAGTTLVKDIRSGSDSSIPSTFATVGGTLFFVADDGTTGNELWKSDSTSAGTVLVKDIAPGSASAFPTLFGLLATSLTNVNGTLFFPANDGVAGSELWRSDGTSSGTSLVRDIQPGSGSSAPFALTAAGGTLFFGADDGVSGRELWMSRGTDTTTMQIMDIHSGAPSSSPTFLGILGAQLLFRADNGTVGGEPFALALSIPPTISSIADIGINEDTPTGAIGFTVGDFETAAASLLVTAASSNQALVPNATVVLGGAGANRTVAVTPAANQSGTTTITVTVTDAHANATTETFVVSVNAVNDPPTISAVANQTVTPGTLTIGPLSTTVGDVETAAGALNLTASSSNQTLVPNAGIALGGSGASRSVTLTLASGVTGTTTILLTVSDGVAMTSTSFTASVVAATPPSPSPPAPTPPPPVSPPLAPTGLAATVIDRSIRLTWTASADLIEAAASAPTGYRVEVGRSSGASDVATFTTGVTTTFTVSDLQAGTYFLRVRAFNADGTSDPSNEVRATIEPTGSPGAPRNLRGSVTNRSVRLEWDAPADPTSVLGYLVEAGSASGRTDRATPVSGLTVVVDDVPEGVYFVRVRTLTAAGTSAPSNELALVVGNAPVPCTAPPGAPRTLTGNVSGSLVQLSWLPPATGEPATSYLIAVGSVSGGSDLGVINVGAGATSFGGVAPDGTFFVRVLAANACGSGGPSNEIAITVGAPQPTAPGAPGNLSADVSGSQVTLRWVPPASGGLATRYLIELIGPAGTPLLTLDTGNTATVFVQGGVPPGIYVIQVRAANVLVGPPSNRVVVTIASP